MKKLIGLMAVLFIFGVPVVHAVELDDVTMHMMDAHDDHASDVTNEIELPEQADDHKDAKSESGDDSKSASSEQEHEHEQEMEHEDEHRDEARDESHDETEVEQHDNETESGDK